MKRLVIDVSEIFHGIVRRYAKADHRSIQGLVRHVLVDYMQQNPKVDLSVDGVFTAEYEKNGSKSIK